MYIRLVEALHRGAPFFSFIIGLGAAALLFHRNYTTIRTAAVPLSEAQDKVVKMDGKCYRFRVEDASCENASKE